MFDVSYSGRFTFAETLIPFFPSIYFDEETEYSFFLGVFLSFC